MSNVQPLLRWIPAPALDPDPGSAGMTMYALDPDPGYAVLASCRHAGLDKPAPYLIRGYPDVDELRTDY